jgi:hypothetical protein
VSAQQLLTYFVALGEESMSQIDDVWVLHFSHDLEFTVFVALVLVDFFDGDVFAGLYHSCLDMDNSNQF